MGVGFLEGRDFYRFTPIHMGGYFYHFTRILRTYFYHFTHQAQISLRALRALCTPLHSLIDPPAVTHLGSATRPHSGSWKGGTSVEEEGAPVTAALVLAVASAGLCCVLVVCGVTDTVTASPSSSSGPRSSVLRGSASWRSAPGTPAAASSSVGQLNALENCGVKRCACAGLLGFCPCWMRAWRRPTYSAQPLGVSFVGV